jgi:hypothetical protein
MMSNITLVISKLLTSFLLLSIFVLVEDKIRFEVPQKVMCLGARVVQTDQLLCHSNLKVGGVKVALVCDNKQTRVADVYLILLTLRTWPHVIAATHSSLVTLITV